MPPRAALMPALEAVLYSGQVGEGQAVLDFEAAFGRWLGNANILSFNSGTAAFKSSIMASIVAFSPTDKLSALASSSTLSTIAEVEFV